jgi:hypothetical protein
LREPGIGDEFQSLAADFCFSFLKTATLEKGYLIFSFIIDFPQINTTPA